MKIAIQGCTHGELEKIYETIQHIEEEQGYKVGFTHEVTFVLAIM